MIDVQPLLFSAIHWHTEIQENLRYLPKRMQGIGLLLRILARWRVCSKTHDFETCKRAASCSGVRMSPGSIDGWLACTIPGLGQVLIYVLSLPNTSGKADVPPLEFSSEKAPKSDGFVRDNFDGLGHVQDAGLPLGRFSAGIVAEGGSFTLPLR